MALKHKDSTVNILGRCKRLEREVRLSSNELYSYETLSLTSLCLFLVYMATKVNISYPQSSLHEAAKYIWDRNPSVGRWNPNPTSVFDVMEIILVMIRDACIKNAKVLLKEKELGQILSDEWMSFLGTGGFYLSIELYGSDLREDGSIEMIEIGVQILIDPAVGHDRHGFITEVFDIT